MERDDLLRGLKAAANALKSQFKSPKGKTWLSNVVAKGQDPTPRKPGAGELDLDRIYELTCYFALVARLSQKSTQFELREGKGPHGYRLPYAPGSKMNFAFFRGEVQQQPPFLDACCGVEILVQGEPAEAPDVFLESAASWCAPSNERGDIVGIWEGKYHDKSNHLDKSEFNQMIGRCSVLNPPKPEKGDLLTSLFQEPFCIHAILTNAKKTPKTKFNRSERIKYGFSIVFGFNGSKFTEVEPTRAEHEQATRP